MKAQSKIVFVSGTFFGIVIAASLSASASLEKFNLLADQKGLMHDINPNLIRAIVSVESAGRLDAVSHKGATGVMQLMPATAERMGVSRSQLFIPERNMEAGTKYLSYLNHMFNGDPRLVAAAYNSGEGAVKKYGGIPPYRETQNYVPSVLTRMKLLELCGTSCYTSKHMRNPQKYIDMYEHSNIALNVTANAQNKTYSAVSSRQQSSNADINSWLGLPQGQLTFSTNVASSEIVPIKKTIQVADAGTQAQTIPNSVSSSSSNTGFVQVLQSDGSYKVF